MLAYTTYTPKALVFDRLWIRLQNGLFWQTGPLMKTSFDLQVLTMKWKLRQKELRENVHASRVTEVRTNDSRRSFSTCRAVTVSLALQWTLMFSSERPDHGGVGAFRAAILCHLPALRHRVCLLNRVKKRPPCSPRPSRQTWPLLRLMRSNSLTGATDWGDCVREITELTGTAAGWLRETCSTGLTLM